MSLKSPEQVRDIAARLRSLTKQELRAGHDAIDADDYGFSLGDEHFDYIWHWFQALVEFYQRAAAAKLSVLFTADQ